MQTTGDDALRTIYPLSQTGRFSPLAGGLALAVLMLPIIMLTTEESIRSVSTEMSEAAIGMGATQTQVVWDILLPTAFPGILTGALLASSSATRSPS